MNNNREIKVRVWDTFNERMVIPYIFESSQDWDRIRGFDAPHIYYETWQDCDDGIRRPCFLMQYTGLRDLKMQEVYEGDIIRWNYDVVDGRAIEAGEGIVKLNQKYCRFDIAPLNSPESTLHFINDVIYAGVIIGNIYQNRELLNLPEKTL